jgi:two-component system chemotaxis response regulator CheY
MAGKRVLSIGQCGPDHYSISWILRQHFGAEVVAARNADQAFELLKKGPFDLILVNRILDADRSSGLELIKQLKSMAPAEQTPIMLVSNLPAAQQQALELGAIPGFGKDELTDDALLERLRPQLAPPAS